MEARMGLWNVYNQEMERLEKEDIRRLAKKDYKQESLGASMRKAVSDFVGEVNPSIMEDIDSIDVLGVKDYD